MSTVPHSTGWELRACYTGALGPHGFGAMLTFCHITTYVKDFRTFPVCRLWCGVILFRTTWCHLSITSPLFYHYISFLFILLSTCIFVACAAGAILSSSSLGRRNLVEVKALRHWLEFESGKPRWPSAASILRMTGLGHWDGIESFLEKGAFETGSEEEGSVPGSGAGDRKDDAIAGLGRRFWVVLLFFCFFPTFK